MKASKAANPYVKIISISDSKNGGQWNCTHHTPWEVQRAGDGDSPLGIMGVGGGGGGLASVFRWEGRTLTLVWSLSCSGRKSLASRCLVMRGSHWRPYDGKVCFGEDGVRTFNDLAKKPLSYVSACVYCTCMFNIGVLCVF